MSHLRFVLHKPEFDECVQVRTNAISDMSFIQSRESGFALSRMYWCQCVFAFSSSPSESHSFYLSFFWSLVLPFFDSPRFSFLFSSPLFSLSSLLSHKISSNRPITARTRQRTLLLPLPDTNDNLPLHTHTHIHTNIHTYSCTIPLHTNNNNNNIDSHSHIHIRPLHPPSSKGILPSFLFSTVAHSLIRTTQHSVHFTHTSFTTHSHCKAPQNLQYYSHSFY